MSGPVVAVTGANGYVGSVIAAALRPQARVIAVVRSSRNPDDIVWSFDSDPAVLEAALRQRGVTHLVHAAWDMKANSLEAMERSCVAGSAKLFAAATAAGIGKLIFISTISAFAGARSAYGRSKLIVEDMALRHGGVVLRLGLVYGEGDSGVFGNLKQTIGKARFVPMIGNGNALQYPLHEDVLADLIRRAVRGDFNDAQRALLVAQPEGITFRALLEYIARLQGKKIKLVAVPWRLLYSALKLAETMGLKLSFRSDSVISFVFQNPAPDFEALARYDIKPVRLRTYS
jgi:nucleoside-diphosphate-sugar epimerase